MPPPIPVHFISCNVAILPSPETSDNVALPAVDHAVVENVNPVHVDPELSLQRQLPLKHLYRKYEKIPRIPGWFKVPSNEHEKKLDERKVNPTKAVSCVNRFVAADRYRGQSHVKHGGQWTFITPPFPHRLCWSRQKTRRCASVWTVSRAEVDHEVL